jgi:hypothetical protein
LSTAVATPAAAPYIITPTHGGKDVDLARSTVYLEFSVHTLGNKRKVSNSHLDLGEADKTLFRLSKKILESPTLAEIGRFDGKTRDLLYDRCHPFKRGTYFLPVTLIEEVDQELRERRTTRECLVARFLAEYPDLCKDASRRLTKKFYNVADYPAVEEVAACFGMSWQYISFGVPEALATVSPAMFAEARQQAAAQVREAAHDIEALMRAKALELVTHLRDRLKPGSDGKKNRLHETAVTNLAEFLAYFDHKNVTRDGDLKGIVDDLRAKLGNADIEAIRNTDTLRERLCQEMTAISEQLGSLVERVPKRRITLH